ncbi:DUF3784 domain-containing protein [Anaerostipes sp.]|uniref:DUF3784 domain-containing protein n=1 Tax=Anaerostipes sp. TaxID=1872530 RepID=UPI0025C341C3|nr:DUF3784 domain-containing protein [Anaerostipes sp.]
MTEIIITVVLVFISASAFIISYFSFKEKGFLFNNAFLWASKQERRDMDKKPHYRQSAIIFFLLGFIFLLNAAEVFFDSGWLFYIVLALLILTIIYAVVSSILIERKNRAA